MSSSWRSTSTSTWQDDFVYLRALMREGSPYEVIAKAEEIAETVSDSIRVAQARQYVLAANMNLRDRPGVIAALARASDAVENCRNYRLIGNFHALAAWADFQSGSLKNCGLHLVNAERALEKMSDTGEPAASAWRNLGLAYSSIGYYEEAESAFGRVLALSDATMWDKGYVQTVVRRALARDHRGDSPGCAKLLDNLLSDVPDETELEDIPKVWLNFAARRLETLGGTSDIRFGTTVDLPLFREMRLLTHACHSIAVGDGQSAMDALEHPDIGGNVAGVAEPLRIRSLALSSLGRHAEALTTERELICNIAGHTERLRPLLLDSASALLDQENLRQTVARYADAAMTDPLTGLPNRRRLDRFLRDLVSRGAAAMIGVIDLDGFKAVNDAHGHATGDQVLKRVAGIVARSVRIGDLLARAGGDEFVVVLPETTAEDAQSIGDRVCEAVVQDEWQRMVIDKTVSVSIGWAPLKPRFTGVADAIHEADQAMYKVKRARARRVPSD
ncbi:MAG TPA: GGDEF domain-containing protein [Candidatus Stackebrandtia excrementipullorum]|nr:GGDEF domain-containing protein [Candidatus Stackebrandtia excrementipullorum]